MSSYKTGGKSQERGGGKIHKEKKPLARKLWGKLIVGRPPKKMYAEEGIRK